MELFQRAQRSCVARMRKELTPIGLWRHLEIVQILLNKKKKNWRQQAMVIDTSLKDDSHIL